MFYYQHHIGDFIKATARLTDEQSMAYLRLMWMYYDQERPILDDIESLAFQLGTSEQTVKLILVSYFKLQDGAWRHSRCDAEIKTYQEKSDKASKAGKASAKRRLNSSSSPVEQTLNSPSSSDEPGFNSGSTSCQPTNNHKPITNKKEREEIFLRPEDVSEQVWEDFLRVRKEKKAPVTSTAMKIFRDEAEKVGITLEKAITYSIERNWQGFKAKWYTEREGTAPASETPWYMARSRS